MTMKELKRLKELLEAYQLVKCHRNSKALTRKIEDLILNVESDIQRLNRK
jgi:hypothetical protein